MRTTNGTTAAASVGFSGKPLVVGSVTAGVVYTGSAWVKADVSTKVNLYLRETNAAGATVGSRTVTVAAGATGWVKVSGAYTAAGSGNKLNVSVWAAGVLAGKGFNTDTLSVTAVA